jgi:hypothetical protein
MRSGDDDVVPRKPLHERRAAFDAVAARRAAAADAAADDMDYDYEGGSGHMKRSRQPEEDEFYTAAKVARQSSKSAKKAAHQVSCDSSISQHPGDCCSCYDHGR